MAMSTLFAQADVSNPVNDMPTLRRALDLLNGYIEDQPDLLTAVSWISTAFISACELAAMGLRFGAELNEQSVDEFTSFVAQTLYEVAKEEGL